MRHEEYDEAIDWLYGLQYFGMKLGLGNTRALLSHMGNPHEKLRAVHVAGTNGKGSVCAFLTKILMESGLKVGTYTSPHLRDFGERICINDFPMTREETLRAILDIKPKVERLAAAGKQCTFFEAATCMAFRHFARRRVDAAVVEVGMGGRLDSTNVLMPVLSVITNISLEHTQHLGGSLDRIAGEKAGIIKPGVPVVTAVEAPEAARVIEGRAGELGSPLYRVREECRFRITRSGLTGSVLSATGNTGNYDKIRLRLAGQHQALNGATAVVAAELLGKGTFPVKKDGILRGMERTRWDARLQIVRLRPMVMVDSTHNPGGAETLARFLEMHFSKKPPVLVLAMLEDKDAKPVAECLEPLVGDIVVTESSYHRRMPAAELEALFREKPHTEGTVAGALERAMELAGNEGSVLVTGSIFTAADAMAYLDAMRVREAVEILSELHGTGAYPGRDPETPGPPPPGSQEPFRVLISTILSQRTKDENTHLATEALFSVFDTPEKLAGASQAEVEALVRPAGFFKQKARNIMETARVLRDSFGSSVPSDMEALMSLPGVGRKTANCVLAYGFGIPAIAVDTHVHRIANLMGLVRTGQPEHTEEVMARAVPEDLWLDINRQLVRHGQTVCLPQRPRCGACPVSHLCDTGIYGSD